MISLPGTMTKRSSRAGPPLRPPSPTIDVPERAIVHVDGARPGDAARVEAERVALVQVVVEHRGEQVVRRGDGVEVAGEVQVDLVHRDHLRVAAAGRAALHPEHRPERRLADADHDLLARAGGAPARAPTVTVDFPSPAGVGLMPVTRTSRPFGGRAATASGVIFALYRPYGRISSGPRPDLGGDVGDGAQLGGLGDLDVGGKLGRHAISPDEGGRSGTVTVTGAGALGNGCRVTRRARGGRRRARRSRRCARSARRHPRRAPPPPARPPGARRRARCACPRCGTGAR